MKIKLSKSQWETIGKESGWMKKAQLVQPAGPGGPFAQPAQQQPAQQQPAQQQPAQQQPAQQQPAQQQPAQQQPKSAKGMTFNALMQDPSFKQTFETIKKQRANEKKILQYWQSIGVEYTSIPEILEVIG